MIFLNLSTSYSVVPYLLFTSNRYINLLVIAAITLAYVFLRFKHWRVPHPGVLFFVYVAIQISCLISAITSNTGWSSVLVYTVSNLAFYFLLSVLYGDYSNFFTYKKSISLLLRGYICLALISVLGSILLFAAVKVGVSPYVNDIGGRYDLFSDNCQSFGSIYYFPYYLAILNAVPDIRIPFFQDAGLISGLYHEPHCMTFMVFPALFLLLFYLRSRRHKLFVGILYLIVLLLEASTTNILSVLVCLVVYLLYLFKSSIKKTVIFLIILCASSIVVVSFMDLSALEFITGKLESGSMTYSMSTIDFALKPKTLFGTSFYNLAFLKTTAMTQSMDVGYVSFVINIVFLFLCVLCLVRLFKSHSNFKLALLLFAVYFFSHSAKVAMVSYSLTMLTFIIFIITHASKLPDKVIDYE